MNTEKYITSKIRILFGSAAFFISFVVFASFFITFLQWVSFKSDAVKIDAVISGFWREDVSGSANYRNRASITYTYDGVTYSDSYSNYNPSMEIGTHVTIYVDKDNPSESRSITGGPAMLIGSLIALVIVIGGGILLFGELYNRVYINRLIERDVCIYADYEQRKITSIVIGGEQYYSTIFKYTDDNGKVHRFESFPFPPSTTPYKEGRSARVYVNINASPKRYFISRRNTDELYQEVAN